MTKSSTTPIVMLTLQDLRDVIREEMGSSVNVTHESETPSASQHVPAKLAGKEVVTEKDTKFKDLLRFTHMVEKAWDMERGQGGGLSR